MDELLKRIPKQINDYYEPFVGGGALFFEIYNMVNHSYLSDLNADLIITYNVIKTNPEKLIELLHKHQESHNEEYYYKTRAMQDMQQPIESSARFIYLMKTCYNGLYRVNKNNEFNTPIGSYKNPTICDTENILADNKALQTATIKYQDFTKITPKKGDFVYFDPPYHPISGTSFTQYFSKVIIEAGQENDSILDRKLNKQYFGFAEEDQIRLRDFALELTKAGVNVMISNSDAEFIVDIYKKSFNVQKVDAPRVVNCKGDKRQAVHETLITNY